MDPQSLERLNAQSQLDLLKKELASVQDELVKQQVTLLQQRAELDLLKTFYPQVFNSFSSLSSVSPAPPPIVIGDYLNSLSSATELTNKVAKLASEQSSSARRRSLLYGEACESTGSGISGLCEGRTTMGKQKELEDFGMDDCWSCSSYGFGVRYHATGQ